MNETAHAAAVAGASAPSEATVVVSSRHRVPFSVYGLLGLADDRFLVWHGAGQVQIGTASGQWGDAIQLPIKQIGDVQPDRAGFLISGSLAEKNSAVLLMDAQGNESMRWIMAAPIVQLMSDSRGRWASTLTDNVVELLPAGTLGAPEQLSGAGPSPYGAPPEVIVSDEAGAVLCRSPDLSKLHHAPGRCERTGDRPWQIEGQFWGPWVACGDWFVAAEGKRTWNVAAYSFATGRVEMRIATSRRPEFVCASPGELFVADRTLSILRLPSRTPVWRRKLTRGRLIRLAVTENALAYQTENSPEIVIIARPRPAAAATRSRRVDR